jgi:hypothetical protein
MNTFKILSGALLAAFVCAGCASVSVENDGTSDVAQGGGLNASDPLIAQMESSSRGK